MTIASLAIEQILICVKETKGMELFANPPIAFSGKNLPHSLGGNPQTGIVLRIFDG